MEDKDIVYHITVCTKRVISVINEKLKNSGLNQSKRKRFIKSLEASTIEKLANNEIWDPQNPHYRSSDRIFRLFDETFCKAVLLSKNNPTEIAHYLSKLSFYSINPYTGIIKYKDYPHYVVYDTFGVINTFNISKLKEQYFGKSKNKQKDNQNYIIREDEARDDSLIGIMGLQRVEKEVCEHCKYFDKNATSAEFPNYKQENSNITEQQTDENGYLLPNPVQNTYSDANYDGRYIAINDDIQITRL